MSISLDKGGNISLTKEAPGMVKVHVGLGWDERQTSGADFDLDASLFLVNADGRCRGPRDFIFYKNEADEAGAVFHTGDNKTGSGDGDDEVIKVDLSKVPADVEKLVVAVTIYDAKKRGQNFGQVSNAYVRLLDDATQQEVVRYDLTEDHSTIDAMIFGELYRKNDEWKFRAVGQGYSNGLKELVEMHGLSVNG